MTEEKNTTQQPDSPTPPPNPVDQADEWMGALSASVAASVINASSLPQASRDRLAKRSYASPNEVNEAIEAESAYLAELTEDQVIEIGGAAPRGGHIQVGLNAIDKITLAAEALLSGDGPASFGAFRTLDLGHRGIRSIEFVPELPKTATGKTQRYKLRHPS